MVALTCALLVIGCESEEEKAAKQAAIAAEEAAKQAAIEAEEIAKQTEIVQNACTEVNLTSKGRGGPLDRLNILKSYEFTPLEAKNVEHAFETRFALEDTFRRNACDSFMSGLDMCICLGETIISLPCEVILIGQKTGTLDGMVKLAQDDAIDCLPSSNKNK